MTATATDLHARIAEHGDRRAALMITYPSTHGVYETAVGDICAAVHAAGQQPRRAPLSRLAQCWPSCWEVPLR